ncbi:Cro/CI family transcriptional regulator [Acinetobacter dispersus]|uniref:Cro/CI family transcriptional regulator n=1 Tax=Acinetobacter dispersus TaxID=70348 RepID=UPI001F4B1DBD|nr:Cro/CI family transcriptional regulator [Acinetobacter dispersus]MCH7391849.1 Cro/CI family transcriptional regulator [Acinetobacter dispersus]
MNVEDLREHFGVKNNSQLAKKINRGRSTVHGWEEAGIPPSTQAVLELLTKGKVKADRQSLTA